MKFFCDTCGQKLEVLDEFAGDMVDCPSCNSRIQVPDADPAVSKEEIEQTFREAFVGSDSLGAMTIGQLMAERKMEGGLQVSKDVLIGDQNLKYEYGNLIAKGGVGAIFLASDQNIRRNVAVKVLLEPEKASNEDILRFIEEAQVTGQLEHPSVVPVHDLGVDGSGNVYYTMKMVKGDNLHTILTRIAEGDKKTIEEFPLARLINIFLKICDAMRFSHSKNVIHRDLKPQNIMVGEFGEVLVMDWGLAKVLGQSRDDPHATAEQIESVRNSDATGALATIAGTIFGTPQFMAPEQAKGATKEMDQRTDIYSLGGILYNILALRPPVRGKTIHEILTKVTDGDIEAPTIFNTLKKGNLPAETDPQSATGAALRHLPGEKVPPALAAVVMKAMALKREDRYQDISNLQSDIEAFQGGFATSAESAGALKLIKLFIQRHQLATFSAVIISLLGSGFIFNTITSAKEIREVSITAAPEFIAKAQQSLREQKFEEAKQAVKTAIGLNDKSPEAWLERARINLDEYNFAKALSAITKVKSLTANPYLIEQVEALEPVIEKWQSRVKRDGKGVLPEHLIAMARELQDIDPTIAARFFFRVGSEQQGLKLKVEDVFAELIEANPGLKWQKGKGKWPMDIYQFYWIQLFQETGIELNLSRYCENPKKLINISPLAILPIKSLSLEGSSVSDLTPLTKIETLRKLNLSSTPILSLKALENTNLNELVISKTRIDDLSFLAKLPLKHIQLSGTRITDFSTLMGMKLETFECEDFPGETIEFLNGMPLRKVDLSEAAELTSIEPLAGAPVESLNISSNPQLTDISALKKMPLKELYLGTPNAPDTSVLQGKEFDNLKLNFDVPNFQFLRQCRTKWLSISSNQSATSLDGLESQRDTLEDLQILGTGNNCKIFNVRALRDLKKLRTLRLIQLPLKDLSPLKGKTIERVELFLPNMYNIDSLKGCKIRTLKLGGGFNDLRGVRWMPGLKSLDLSECHKLTQIKALAGMPDLEELKLPESVKDIESIRNRKKIQRLNYGRNLLPADQFWRSFDNRSKKGRR